MAGPPYIEKITASGPQTPQPGEDPFGLVQLGVGTLGVASIGFIPTRNGRVWDHYVKLAKAVESGFPGGVLKTFRVSESISIFESWKHLHVNKKVFEGSGNSYADFLRRTFGEKADSVSLNRSGAVFGDVVVNGKTVGVGLNISAGGPKGAGISDYYARIMGMDMSTSTSLNDDILKAEWRKANVDIPFKEWKNLLTPAERKKRLIIGARFRDELSFFGRKISLTEKQSRLVAKAEVTSNFFRAKAATTAGRLNNLLTKPFEVPIIGDVLDKIPVIRHAAIKPGSSIEMLGRYIKKGAGIAAAYKGLEYYDYLRASENPFTVPIAGIGGAAIGGFLFNKPGAGFSKGKGAIGASIGLATALLPRFNSGLFYGAATIGTDLNVLRAKASEAIGLTEQLQRQEEITPGLMSPMTAIGMAGVGTMAAGLYRYTKFLGKSFYTKATKGGALGDIFEATRQTMSDADTWDNALGRIAQKLPGGKLLSKIKNPYALGALAGFGLWAASASAAAVLSGNYLAALPGAGLLGSAESSEELEAIYSGEKEVAIRKGRWWEFGRSSRYEGGKIDYYRPHAIHRLKTRAYQKGLWGTEEEKWEHDPLLHPFKALFGDDEWKYYYEEKYKYERPAPLTGTYGEDIPFIGPLVAATFGKLFKPRKAVRSDEWMLGEDEYKHKPDSRKETEPYYKLGGIEPGAPVAPDEGSQLINELIYKRREAIGLPGFVEGAIFDAVTGREELMPNKQTLATMGKETGAEYWLWQHLDVGGAAGSSEVVRRFIPRTRSYLDTYNPLKNNMPWWMPNNYFMDYKYGNPFDKIKEAEIRLPGAGYAALHPELEGIAPKDYPLMHRLKILADVAMWSPEYKETLKTAKRRSKYMSEKDQARIKEIEAQVKSRKVKKEFQEYRFDEGMLRQDAVTIREILSPKRFLTEEYGDLILEMQGVGRIEDKKAAMEWAEENLLGKQIEVMTPSLESRSIDLLKAGGRMKVTTMVGEEDYGTFLSKQGWSTEKELKDEFEQIRFTKEEQMAGKLSEKLLHLADTPFEMLTPFSPASKFIRQRTAIEDYAKTEAIGTGNAFWNKPLENFFLPAKEMIEYNLGDKEIPENIQQRRAIENYFDMLEWIKAKRIGDEEAAGRTMFGVDVFSSPQNIMAAIPRRDRDYFKAFSEAKSAEDRQKILDLTPSNQDRIYTSIWLRQEEEMARGKKRAKIDTAYENTILATTYAARKSEGFEINPQLEDEWLYETKGGVQYDDWIRNKKAEEYFATHSLPGADWIGWHPSVDMEDVKLKYVENAGLDHHDFDLWGQRKRSLGRKPYISDELVAQLENPDSLIEDKQVEYNVKSLIRSHNNMIDANIIKIDADIESTYDIDIMDSRIDMIEHAYKYMGTR